MAVYPGAAAADSDLHVSVNNLSTLLNGLLAPTGDNTSGSGIAVASTANFPTEGYITIDAEAIHYTGITGNNFTGITRGADGTVGASHVNNSNVYHNVIAAHHNALKDETKAVESDLVNVQGALTQSQAPASLAATIFQRLSQIITQIKTLLGTTNWYDSVPATIADLRSAFSNILDNGGFEIWQRGSTFTNPANGAYTSDRWKIVNQGTLPTYTVTQELVTVDGGVSAMKINVTANGGNTGLIIEQLVENFQEYAGKTVTLYARIKSSASGGILVGVSDGVTTGSTSVGVTVGYQTFVVTFTLSASPTALQIIFGTSGAALPIGTYYLDSFMLVVGSSTIPFVPANPERDLARCQRYYETGRVPETVVPVLRPGAGGGDTIWQMTPFLVQKRVAPTVTPTLVTVTISAQGGQTGGDAADTGAWTISSPEQFVNAASVQLSRATDGGFPAALIEFTWTASADL